MDANCAGLSENVNNFSKDGIFASDRVNIMAHVDYNIFQELDVKPKELKVVLQDYKTKKIIITEDEELYEFVKDGQVLIIIDRIMAF